MENLGREKQIEEMAKIINKPCYEIFNEAGVTGAEVPGRFCPFPYECNECTAINLYNAGYRKQSENTVELPCKIGDTVYIIDEADDESGEDYVLAVKVLQFFINEHGIAIELELPLGMRLNTWMVVGENVFLTEAEAEKALAKMKGEENG